MFGIISYSFVIFCENNLEKIINSVIKLVNKDDKIFKILVRRNNKKFELISVEIN